MSVVPTIALRVPPEQGEALDYWLMRLSRSLMCAPGDIAEHLGHSRQVWHINRSRLADHGVQHQNDLESAQGLPLGTLSSLTSTLRAANVAGASPLGIGVSALTRRLPHTRYCPQCLREQRPWQWSWRIPWYTCCPIHNYVLVDACPTCQRQQGKTPIRSSAIPESLQTCEYVQPRYATRSLSRCGGDLRQTAMIPAPSPAIELQEHLLHTISTESPGKSAQILTDLRLLPSKAQARILDMNRDTNTSAVATVLADLAPAIVQRDVRRVVTDHRRDTSHAHHIMGRFSRASAEMQENIVAAVQSELSAVTQLRWSTTTRARKPYRTCSDLRKVTPYLPGTLWPNVALDLLPADLPSTHEIFSQIACLALLVPGSNASCEDIAAAHPRSGITGRNFARVWRSIERSSQHSHSILHALTEISQSLHENPAPINYERRSTIALDETLLSQSDWHDICGQAGHRIGQREELPVARAWLWLTLTTQPRTSLPIPATQRVALLRGITRLQRNAPQHLFDLLTQHAHTLLNEFDMSHEPLTWQPNLSHHTATLNHHEKEQRLLEQALATTTALSKIARSLNMSLTQAELLLGSPLASKLRSQRSSSLTTAVTDQEIRDALEKNAMSTRKAALQLQVGRTHLAQRCSKLNLQPQPRGLERNIDRQWLYEQYINQRRSLSNIATELGYSPAHLARVAKSLNIPLRNRGGASHQSELASTAHLPEPLASAAEGRYGCQRIERFLHATQYRSLNHAAQQMGLSPTTLLQQIQRLEQQLHGELFTRTATRKASMHLTELGRQLYQQACQNNFPQNQARSVPNVFLGSDNTQSA